MSDRSGKPTVARLAPRGLVADSATQLCGGYVRGRVRARVGHALIKFIVLQLRAVLIVNFEADNEIAFGRPNALWANRF